MTIEQQMSGMLASLLWRQQVIQVRENEPFRLASGNCSPIYINCRPLISGQAIRGLVLAFAHYRFHEMGLQADCIAGGETAGIPFGAWLARDLDKPFIYIRKKAKSYGIDTRIEGSAVGRVLLFEDLITDGGSKLGFVEAIREARCDIGDCLVIVDREGGGAEALAKLGVSLHALTTLTKCLQVGRDEGILSANANSQVREYFTDPKAWHEGRGLKFSEARQIP
jgi:orotate phosphoribosyltransferase